MSRIGDGLTAILRHNHLAESRLAQLADPEATPPASAATPVAPAEQAHLEACARCRSLLVGHRRAAAILGGAWRDRPLGGGAEALNGRDGVGGVRVGRLRAIRPAGRRATQRWAIPVVAAALLVGAIVSAGLLGLRGSGQPAASGSLAATTATPSTPAGTDSVARLVLGQYGTFAWSPDGAHLLVSDESGSRVYDRSGGLVSQFGPVEGWLDAGHLIGGDGYVADINTSHAGGPTSNSWVVANGHGSAAIIVAVPACVGDPIVDWYRDGRYVRANEKVTPYGWSLDGKLALFGHLDCSSEDAEMHGWKGPVDVVDFASGRVLATAPGMRGDMAFNPSGTRLAAGSDTSLEIVTIATGKVETVPNARLLGWLDDDHVYCLVGGAAKEVAIHEVGTNGGPQTVTSGEWQIPSSAGPRLVADAAGAARRIVGADGSTTLLDLSRTSLAVGSYVAADRQESGLQQRWWSPDGRMLALKSSDGTSLVLISVDPAKAGAIDGALPTPIGSPQAFRELDRTPLPGPVSVLVSDPKRDALWFLGGESGGPVELYLYDVATAKLSKHPIDGTTYDAVRDRLAVAPDGRLWVGAGYRVVVYDPEADTQASLTLPSSGSEVQVDPKEGKADPWVAGIAFDGTGRALIARNWARSLLVVDSSLNVLPGQIDVSDGLAMTGGMVVAGGRVFVVADPEAGLVLGVDATGSGTLSNSKFQTSGLVAVGDRVLTAGSPPGWIDAEGGGAAMIEPVMASADLVAAGPDGTAVLCSNATGEIQWRDREGKVSAQAVFQTGAAPRFVALAFDAQGRLWAVEPADGAYSLVRLDVGP